MPRPSDEVVIDATQDGARAVSAAGDVTEDRDHGTGVSPTSRSTTTGRLNPDRRGTDGRPYRSAHRPRGEVAQIVEGEDVVGTPAPV